MNEDACKYRCFRHCSDMCDWNVNQTILYHICTNIDAGKGDLHRKG